MSKIRNYTDKKFNFKEVFDPETGFYMRSDDPSGNDPFMRSVPGLIDIGIMGHCEHGKSGLCLKAGVQCYQSGNHINEPNMPLEDYKNIITDTKDYIFQVALGGRGDPDMHENFEEILRYTRENNVVPNFTTSGLGMTPEKAQICKKYCGAVAISMYSRLNTRPELALRRVHSENNKKVYKNVEDIPVKFTFGNEFEDCKWDAPEYIINGLSYAWDELHHMYYSDEPQEYEFYRIYNEKQENNYTFRAVKMLLDAGVKTNIHYVLSKTTIDEAILRLKYNGFPNGINAVIFLLHKPIGLGSEENVLDYNDPRVKEFFTLIDENKFTFKIGFDSCTVPAIINHCNKIDPLSIDSCEAARYSMYIDSNSIAYPCSFDNDKKNFAVKIDYNNNINIETIWNSEEFERFRNHFHNSCANCPNHSSCYGGCPLSRQIVLCNKETKDLK